MTDTPSNSKVKIEFSARLNAALEDRGYTTEKGWPNKRIAKKIGVSEPAVSKLRGAKMLPAMETGIIIATWLGVSFEWLMTGRGTQDLVLDSKFESLRPDVKEIIIDIMDQPEIVVDHLVNSYRALKQIAELRSLPEKSEEYTLPKK